MFWGICPNASSLQYTNCKVPFSKSPQNVFSRKGLILFSCQRQGMTLANCGIALTFFLNHPTDLSCKIQCARAFIERAKHINFTSDWLGAMIHIGINVPCWERWIFLRELKTPVCAGNELKSNSRLLLHSKKANEQIITVNIGKDSTRDSNVWPLLPLHLWTLWILYWCLIKCKGLEFSHSSSLCGGNQDYAGLFY